MPETVAMSVQDALWLTMDRPNNLMVVDGAMVLAATPTMPQVREVYQTVATKFPVFRRKAVPAGMGWAWQDDPEFELDRHITEVTLPGRGDMRELQAFVAAHRTDPLPKDRPLWQVFVVSPVRMADGTQGAAIVSRMHHAIADGVRLTQVMLGMCELSGEAAPIKVARSGDGNGPGGLEQAVNAARTTAAAAGKAVTDGISGAASDVAEAVRHPRRTITGLPQRILGGPSRVAHGVEDGVQLLRHPDHLLDALEVLGAEPDRGLHDLSSVTKIALAGNDPTVWTGKPGTKKAIAWSDPLPLDRIKAIGKTGGWTINDVLLAAVAGGLRRYLAETGGLIDEVNWMVPVNLKPFEDNLPEDLGNYFALVFLPMPLNDVDMRERLTQMHHRMDRIKHSDEAVLTFGLQRIVSMSPGPIAFFLTNFFANKAVGVLTNVPGPRGLLTFAGIPVKQVVGFAPCSGDQPMTAAIFSYNGEVTVGFAADAGLMPDPDELADYVVDEIESMAEEFLPKPRKRAAARRAPAGTKKG